MSEEQVTRGATYDFPTERIALPSKGKYYAKETPLSEGFVDIKYMTAGEEEILTSSALIKAGTVLDRLFEAVIVSKGVNPNDILIGDKDAILMATRILGYGAQYPFQVTCPNCNHNQEASCDLTEIQTREYDEKLPMEFKTSRGDVIKFKLLTHGDEKAINADIKALQKVNATSAELTTRLRYTISSINDKTDIKDITDFVKNKFLLQDTREFRKYVAKVSPGLDMTFRFECESCGHVEVLPIRMGVGFFWPEE